MDITQIVRCEYEGISSASLVGDTIKMTDVFGRSHKYKLIDGELYHDDINLETLQIHLDKFDRIFRLANRDKNIQMLTDDEKD